MTIRKISGQDTGRRSGKPIDRSKVDVVTEAQEALGYMLDQAAERMNTKPLMRERISRHLLENDLLRKEWEIENGKLDGELDM